MHGLQLNQPMGMPGQNPAAPMTHSPMSTNMDTSKVNQPNNVAQGVQFARKIQHRISEIEQKLATPMSDTDRQSLQRAHQELARLQATLVQKISQGLQIPASSGASNMMPSASAPNMPTFTPSTFANATPSKLGTNILTNQTGSVPTAQPSMSMPTAQHTQTSNVSITPDQFKRTLSELMRRHGKSLSAPVVDGREVDLYQLFTTVQSLGGSKAVTQKNMWHSVSMALGFISLNPTQQASTLLQFARVYKDYLGLFEDVWNRAMLHQLSMGRNNPQMINPNVRTEGNAMKLMVQPQATQPRPSNFAVMQSQQGSQPQTQQTARIPLPFTKEQLASLNLTSEQITQLLQQQAKSITPTMPQNSNQSATGSQNWTPAQQNGATPIHTRTTEPTKQQQNTNKSPEKQRWQSLKVTSKMLEDAEGLLRKIEMSLNVSRPKLPIIESMTESDKSNVFQQMEKLIPLKATVSALLPAFLAMSGNIEPAKRVKIMVYMFEDQLALLPKRQCILRPSDLEKLKIQMTRCIGFVRMNDDKLAQRIIAKTLASQPKEAQKRNASEDPRCSFIYSESNKKAKNHYEPSQQESMDVNQPIPDSSKSRSTSQKSGDGGFSSKTGAPDISKPPNSDIKSIPTAGSPGTETRSEKAADAVDKTLDKMMTDHQRNTELAQSDPLQFVRKAWSDLLSVEEVFTKHASFMVNLPAIDDKPIGDRQIWTPMTVEAAIMDMIDAPSVVQGSETHANNNKLMSKVGGSITIGSQSVLQMPNLCDEISDSSHVRDPSDGSQNQDRADRPANTTSTSINEWWQMPLFASAS